MTKRSYLFLLLLSLTAFSLHSQPILSDEFGVISGAAFKYTLDFVEDASAVILFDIGKTRFADSNEGWYEIEYTRTIRIKILSAEGLDHATFYIPYYVDGFGKTERVSEISGNTYNLNEQTFKIEKTEFDKKQVFEEKINNYWNKKVLTLPQAKVGSVVEIKYTIISPFFFNLPDWEFQSSIPTEYSRYTVSLIPFYNYVTLGQRFGNYVKMTEKLQDGLSRSWRSMEFREVVYSWEANKVPPFEDESYISSRQDCIMKIDFQLSEYSSPYGGNTEVITTWPKLSEGLLSNEEFGRYLKRAEKEGETILSELNLDGQSLQTQTKSIIEYVRQNFSWNEHYGKYTKQSPKSLVETRTGNIAEINLMLTGILRAAGIDAYPVLISTRGHGKVWTDYPFASFFNYILIHVNNGKEAFLTDGTDNSLAYNRIPEQCVNDVGLLIDKEPGWVNLYAGVESLDQKIIRITPNVKELTGKYSVIQNLTEFEAARHKRRYRDDSTKIASAMLNNYIKSIDRLQTRNYDIQERPYTIAYSGESKLETFDNKIVINPLLGLSWNVNPLKSKERTYPVDMVFLRKESYTSYITIPEGYTVDHLPESMEIEDELVSLSYKADWQGNSIAINTVVAFKKTSYEPEVYATLKAHFGKIVSTINQSVVLAKE